MITRTASPPRDRRPRKRPTTKAVAGGTALLLALSMQGLGVGPAGAAGPVSAGLTITPTDLNFILKQIQIAEAHATYEGATPGTVRPPNSVLSTTGSDGSANAPHVVNFTLPHGLRTVDGRGNNLTVLTDADQQRVPTSPALAKDLGAADRKFPRMVPLANITWKDDRGRASAGPRGAAHRHTDQWQDRCRTQPRASSATSSPTSRTATPQRSRQQGRAWPPPAPQATSNFIPNQVPNNVLAAPTSSMFTLFGQFFDHGLDLVGKSGTEAVVVPLAGRRSAATSPGSPTNFIIANRTILDPALDAHQHHDAVDRPEPDLRLDRLEAGLPP